MAEDTTVFGGLTRRKIHLRRRKLPQVRLGGGIGRNRKPRGGFFLAKLLKRIKVRWVKLRYSLMMKKLKQYYRNMIKDLIEAGATMESLQQRVFTETSFAVPVMGISSTNYPSASASAMPRSSIFI